ncbi:DUF397 domain-containing protein [Sphaerisporangium sp. NPDC051017]|uniref:DUF397 domain-containing protein n=1 Tax=Sphaerisporangium sp. NPDC051017 TaxID=3154636 RepID=UPI00342CC206
MIKTEFPEYGLDWRKSSYGGGGNNCVEVASRAGCRTRPAPRRPRAQPARGPGSRWRSPGRCLGGRPSRCR